MASTRGDTYRTLGTLGSVGLSFVVALVLGTWAGHAVDRWLGTSWVMILGFFLGFAAGVLNVYRVVSQATAEAASSNQPGPRDSSDQHASRLPRSKDRPHDRLGND